MTAAKFMLAILAYACGGGAGTGPGGVVIIPWTGASFEPNEGCYWSLDTAATRGLKMNEHYLAPPSPDEDWLGWYRRAQTHRRWLRRHPQDASERHIVIRFDGIRAWARAGREWAFAAELREGERLAVEFEACWVEGGNSIGISLDFCDRASGSGGRWTGWAGILASARVPTDGAWHSIRLEATVPAFDESIAWARPIVGMDAYLDPTPGMLLVRGLQVEMPRTAARESIVEAALQRPSGLDTSIYDRADLAWATRNFVSGFVFVYDTSFWNPETGEYRVEDLCREAEAEFGGYDSVLLWPAYPRIGADDRNQFDFLRDMPGGIAGLRDVVARFHRCGVRVLIPYNPWDTGTRREGCSDEEALAWAVAALDADGVFLDTMTATGTVLRTLVDAARPGVIFEPEGHPPVEAIEVCSASWAQGLRQYPDFGVLRLKWLEPRHMQHQISRWTNDRFRDLAAAWLNGSGVLVWENIFGSWNGWGAKDRAVLRRMAPVLRHFSRLAAHGRWSPYVPTLAPGVLASRWEGEGIRFWTLVNQSDVRPDGPVLEAEARGARFFDVWNGRELRPLLKNGVARISVPLDRFGAVAALPARAVTGLRPLLDHQRAEAARGNQSHGREAAPVLDARPAPYAAPRSPGAAAGMLHVGGGTCEFVVSHMRRECGCYPDPGTPPEEWGNFLRGWPHEETIEHHVTEHLEAYAIEPHVVTNGDYERFLRATGYRPRFTERFLEHWQGRRCPSAIRGDAVVYVDLDDARAYAAWAGMRLPTEWEWQRAAEVYGESFVRGVVWEWTESERSDGHTRFVMLRGGSRYRAEGSVWYFPGGEQPISTHAKFIRMWPGLDRCSTIGFRCVVPLSP